MAERVWITIPTAFVLNSQEKHSAPSNYRYPDSVHKLVQKLPLPVASLLRGSQTTWQAQLNNIFKVQIKLPNLTRVTRKVLIEILDSGVVCNSNPLFYNQALCSWKDRYLDLYGQFQMKITWAGYCDYTTLTPYVEFLLLPNDPYNRLLLLY